MLENLTTISSATYLRLLRFVIENRRNLLVFGTPGIGKTEMAHQVIDSTGYKRNTFNLSTLEPPDFVGVTMVDDENRTSHAPPVYMPVKGLTDKPEVMVFDEIDKAEGRMQNPLLQVFQDHRMNTVDLNIQAVIALANMPDDNSYSQELSRALTNRCLVYVLELLYPEWERWAVGANIHPLIVGFLSQSPELFNVKSSYYAKESPRSWTEAARDLTALGDSPDVTPDEKEIIIAGRVGYEAAKKFKVWLSVYRDLYPTIQSILEGTNFKRPEDSSQEFVAGISALAKIRENHNVWKNETVKEKKDALSAKIRQQSERVFSYIASLKPSHQFGIVRTGFHTDVIDAHTLSNIQVVRTMYTEIYKLQKANTVDIAA